MDALGGPETKKARWSPNSFTNSPNTNGGNRDLFANYGYGSQAAINQPGFPSGGLGMNGTNGLNGLGSNQLYSTPSLSVNTATNGLGMGSQISPSSATSPFATMQQQQQTGQPGQNGNYNFGGYGMNGMNGMLGMGGMGSMGMLGGFPYSPQIGSFQQVRDFKF